MRQEPGKHALLAAHVRAPAPNTLSSQTANPFPCRGKGRHFALLRAFSMLFEHLGRAEKMILSDICNRHPKRALMPIARIPRPRGQTRAAPSAQCIRISSEACRKVALNHLFVRQSNPRVRQLLTQSPKLSPFARACSKAGLVAEPALETTFSAGTEASSAGRFLPRPKFALGASGLYFSPAQKAGARLFSSSGRQRGRLKQPKAFP